MIEDPRRSGRACEPGISSVRSEGPMSSVEDLRPTFVIARAFGLAPYSIRRDGLALSKRAIAYSVPWLLFDLYGLYSRLSVYLAEDAEYKARALSMLRTILLVAALVADVALGVAWDARLQRALGLLRGYDLAVKYDVKSYGKFLRIHSWTVLGFLIVYFTIIGWFTYMFETYEHLMAAVIYVYFYLPMAITVMKFVALVTSILLRFRHLNRMLLPGFLPIVMEIDSGFKRLDLRDICWLHSYLVAAAENINALYSLQLLLWFANLTFNTITRIYGLMETDKPPDTVKIIRDGGLILMFVLLVTLVAGVCHFTSMQANKVGAIVFSPSSKYFRVRLEQDKEDKFYIGQYFALHPLHFSAAFGFFRINLPLLLQIAGAMTTYLVILKSPTKN